MMYTYVKTHASTRCVAGMPRWRGCATHTAQCWGLGSVTRCVARHVRVLLPPLWQARVCARPLLCGAER